MVNERAVRILLECILASCNLELLTCLDHPQQVVQNTPIMVFFRSFARKSSASEKESMITGRGKSSVKF